MAKKPYGVNELREMFLSYFESKDHLRLPSFSLIPQNDKSLLLINSGMAPMKPYFKGEVEPSRTLLSPRTCSSTTLTSTWLPVTTLLPGHSTTLPTWIAGEPVSFPLWLLTPWIRPTPTGKLLRLLSLTAGLSSTLFSTANTDFAS